MRPSFTVALLLILSLTLSEQAQGIRLGKWDFMSSLLGANKEEHKPIIDHEKEIITSSRNSRKLFSTTTVTTPPSSTSTTTSKNNNEKNGGREEEKYSSNNNANSLKTTITTSDNDDDDDDQHPDQYEPYSEAVDLAEMDYSPARRKTPIHN
ncbi:hypothetical protein G4B88_000337 [Cannabis sativa]|uniref:Uncharacterized protein n=1 Tax=Cannabis sativa TaxID=3483 RepID=A0A7J6F3I2_CANSA|nr:hypothetical protein G4B88_000337 [Cannabis sativa]